MPKKEKDFQTQIKRAFDYYCSTNKVQGSYTKIPDTGYSKNPYDCYFKLEGARFYACELKINKAKGTFNFQNFFKGREHEIRALKKDKDLGFSATVLINHFLGRGHNKAYLLDIDDVIVFHCMGTIKLEELQEKAIELPLVMNEFVHESVFDLTKLFE